MVKLITVISLVFGLLAGFVLSPVPVNGQYYSSTTDNKQIVIDKKVKALEDKTYQDNIDKSVRVFYENDTIDFEIKVNNTGSRDLNQVNVTDRLPGYLTLVYFPGTYDSKLQTISWTIDKLSAGETKSYYVRARISGSHTLVNRTGEPSKMTNVAIAKTEGIEDSDESIYYVGQKTIPVTGNENLILSTMLSLSVVATGFGLRRVARGY